MLDAENVVRRLNLRKQKPSTSVMSNVNTSGLVFMRKKHLAYASIEYAIPSDGTIHSSLYKCSKCEIEFTILNKKKKKTASANKCRESVT